MLRDRRSMTPKEIGNELGVARRGAIKLLHVGNHRSKPDASVSSAYRGNPPIVKIHPSRILPPMKRNIRNCMAVVCVATSALALSTLLVGCDKEVSSTKSSSESSDGTIKSKEKTVTESPDGKTTKTEESKSTTTTNKP